MGGRPGARCLPGGSRGGPVGLASSPATAGVPAQAVPCSPVARLARIPALWRRLSPTSRSDRFTLRGGPDFI